MIMWAGFTSIWAMLMLAWCVAMVYTIFRRRRSERRI